MKRRSLLAALSAVPLAGCVGSAGDPSPTDEPATTETPRDGVQRTIQLDAVEEAPAEGLGIDAEVVESAVTEEHPARVAVTTTNDGRKRNVSIAPGQCCLFNRNGGASDPAGLWLHRVESSAHIDRDGDRWSRDAPADQPRAYPAYACLSKTFAAGEALTTEYDVWDDYRTEPYFEPGTYRFAEQVTVREPGGDNEEETDVIAEFDWGFSVRVEAP